MNPDDIDVDTAPSGPGCVDCDADGGWWVHLRRCARCGHVGCCDQSLQRHATRHWEESGHPIMQSYEPGEDWFWDYRRGADVEGAVLMPPRSHPRSQSVPGPKERVPANWRELLA